MDTVIKTETTDADEITHYEMPAIEDDPFLKGLMRESISGAEMLARLKESGAFEVWAKQYKDIGPGKKYADSTEYVQAMRARVE